MKTPSFPPYITSARGTASSRVKKTRASKAADKEWHLECFENIKRQVEPQLREQGHKQPATEAERIAAAAIGYTVEGIRQVRTRVRRRASKVSDT
jgi:hypothetical protein